MHLLLLALNYAPDKLGNAPLMTGLAEGLVRRGHRVSVICAFPHHEKGRIEAPYRGKLFQREQLNGVEVLRSYIYAPEGGALAKVGNYASFTLSALAVSTLVRDVDLIFTPSPPLTLGLVDQLLSLSRGIPFVYNLQDLFPEAAIRLGVLKNPLVIRGFEGLERHIYRSASHLSVISEGFKRFLLERGVPAQKITVIPNYTDTQFIQPMEPEESPYRERYGLKGRFVLQFSGRMGYSQGLETVVEAWRRLKDLPDLRLMMVGDGQARSMLEERLGADPRVLLLPTQAREDLPALLGCCNLGLAPLRRGMAGTSVPSKIFGILAAGRPVIAGVDPGSDTEEMILNAECGRIVPPEDPEALAVAVRELYEDPDLCRDLGARARAYVETHHAQEGIIDQYEAMLSKLLRRRR